MRILLVFFIDLSIWGFGIQESYYQNVQAFVAKCYASNGVYSQAQVGWFHDEEICTPIPTK